MRKCFYAAVGLSFSPLRCQCQRFSSSPTSSPPTFQPNYISMTNQQNKDEYFKKFGSGAISQGIPRISRLSVRPISILHETPRVLIAGRNFANGFGGNQYLLIHRLTRSSILIDCVDDWPDDWIAFMKSSQVKPTYIFLTHCHVDNVLQLNAFQTMIREAFDGLRVGVMWNPSEQPWVDSFPRACERYGRVEEMVQPLPLLQCTSSAASQFPTLVSTPSTPASARLPGHPYAGRPRIGHRPPPPAPAKAGGAPQYENIFLSSATNRSTSFHELGPHTPLHYLHTPGHSPGHSILHVALERLLFSGDLIGYNHVGRVDLPWATGAQLSESLLKLEDFPDETVLLPGHGRLTTLGRERRYNRALQVLYTRKHAQPQQEVSVGFNSGYL